MIRSQKVLPVSSWSEIMKVAFAQNKWVMNTYICINEMVNEINENGFKITIAVVQK